MLKDIKNTSNNTTLSSYGTASSLSFDQRNDSKSSNQVKSSDVMEVKDDDDISQLENDISMMSVSSPRTPLRSPYVSSSINLGFRRSPSSLLSNLKTDAEKSLLKEHYPEIFNPKAKGETDLATEEIKPETSKKYFYFDLDDSDDDKENRPPNVFETEEKTKSININNEKVANSDEDELENYIKVLKDNKPKERLKAEKVPPRSSIKKFVVDDSDISFEEDSLSSSSISYDDESYEENVQKKEKGRIPKKAVHKVKDDDEYFLTSLSVNYNGVRHKDATQFIKDGSLKSKKIRESLIIKLMDIYMKRCFQEIKRDLLNVNWNSRLRKTAGLCRNHTNGSSTIEISPTVCTSADRVRDTLIHELCHSAVWIVNKLYKEGHGDTWKNWARKCMREFKSLPLIERCHNYEIEAKYLYVCENEQCQQTIKRQSKSLDIQRKICGKCRGKFNLYRFDKKTKNRVLVETSVKSMNKTTEKKEEKQNKFALFVKENYSKYRVAGTKHAEVMELLSNKYKQLKLQPPQ